MQHCPLSFGLPDQCTPDDAGKGAAPVLETPITPISLIKGHHMTMFKLTIKSRLALAMVILSVLLLTIGVTGLIGMSAVVKINRELYQVRMPKTVAADNALLWIGRQRTSLDQAALTTDPAWAERMYKTEAEVGKQALEWWAKYTALPQTDDAKKMVQDVTEGIAKTEKAIDEFRAAIKSGDRQKIADTAKNVGTVYTAMQKSGSLLNEYETKAALDNYEDSVNQYENFRMMSVAAIVVGLLLAGYSWLSLRRAISNPIEQALKHFDEIAEGDLTQTVAVTSNDEMGQLLQGLAKMQENLTRTVRTVRHGSEAIATATKEISAGNQDLSSRTEQQAASLEETASSMEELTSTVKHNADNARQASTLAINASQIASSGNDVVTRVVSTMDEIKDSSAKITEIVGIIDGIAFQTNILALNAAVEAARAGEQGRGFAVVASEVRALAQRSSSAAKEIKDLIMLSVDRVQTGSTLASQAGETMSEIITAVQRVTDIMGEISSASSEQSSGIDQVSHAVSQMDEATQQNAALVEQASAAAKSLEQQALSLKDAVAIFRLREGDRVQQPSRNVAAARPVPSPGTTRPVAAPIRTIKNTPRKALATTAKTSQAPALPKKSVPAIKAADTSGDDWETF
jgi:methyl-accepting chemotaxis protein I, serine sensor receptor